MMRILHVVGARPQFIKLKAVYEAISDFPSISQVVIHTGQHYDYAMSEVFFEELSIPAPDENLGVGSADHDRQVAMMLPGLAKSIRAYRPSWVVLYGDTNSTLAGALAANMCKTPVAHVEAGMRSFRRHMPEERNRIVTDHLSDMLFAASPTAMANLRKEGLEKRAVEAGDVMLDVVKTMERNGVLRPGTAATNASTTRDEYVLATIHRAENTDNRGRLKEILIGLGSLGQEVIFPMHPRTRRAVAEFGLEKCLPRERVRVVEPLSYIRMLRLIKGARVVVTDSGGVQKEAYYLRVPCVTVRDETEWPETLRYGANRLVAADRKAIAEGVLRDKGGCRWEAPYGNGSAARVVAEHLLNWGRRGNGVTPA